MRAHLATAAALAALLAAGCSSNGGGGPDAGPPDAGPGADCILVPSGVEPQGSVPFDVETVASGLEVPWGLAFLPDGDLLVTERPGRVRLVHQGVLQPTPVATLNTQVTDGEGGLLGIALHPDFATTRQFFLYVTHGTGSTRSNGVERWVLAPDARSASLERVIFESIPGAVVHDGGRLRIGPDRMLYVGTGDATEPSRAQDVNTPAGKLLRLTPDGAVPQDNPFPGQPAFLLGVRNTQGFDFLDAQTLYVVDHGPSGGGAEGGRRAHDEVNLAHRGDNLGWPDIYSCETQAGRVTPSITWETAHPPGGAALYTGTSIPEWRGSLLVGVLGARQLHRVVFDPANPGRVQSHEAYLQGTYGRLREVIMGPDGHLYVTTSNCDGRGTCPADGDRILRLRRH
ncbi:PQQ-dependent sugar dehydrogenase [Aggregicoccus sp. 17bor-14]|uniref:PQQ-dependent sugar dehydrogenase n=1 Tax=Myxococcaceae TaxID=31 RepID=UPI00129C6214|nr:MULTISPECIES: PQQ-dependent sugar dehydrogenase [Myxococcaceae]MBF5041717.1 PQQ-dependent sugar dehydrogenase [Simulacricoccus sp. 17bor-14]MRI87498.1 PQQ-dependent sugar dehydrogenase [Aggregicoccus sp. 17bor-14]